MEVAGSAPARVRATAGPPEASPGLAVYAGSAAAAADTANAAGAARVTPPMRAPSAPSPAAIAAAAAAEELGGRGALLARPAAADNAEVEELAARAVPRSYFQSGAARARLEVFKRRGRLARELTALGLPPVYEHKTGAAGQGGQDSRPWRRLRDRALNPAHNPVMARNIRQKAQLAGRAATAAPPGTSARALRYEAAMSEAERTISKLLVVGGAEERRMCSAPVSKPYYPHRRAGGLPSNETEGGDLMPGKLAKLVTQQKAEEQLRLSAEKAAPRPLSEAERRRQEQIQKIAQAIVDAPQMGIRELRALLPHEQDQGLPTDSGAATPSSAPSSASALDPASSYTAELADALRQLDLISASARATVGAAEDDYGQRTLTLGRAPAADGRGAVTLSRAPSSDSLGSGGHYLDEEGMAEDDAVVEAAEAAAMTAIAAREGAGASAGVAEHSGGSRYPSQVVVDVAAGLVVTRYPVAGASRRQQGPAHSSGDVNGGPSSSPRQTRRAIPSASVAERQRLGLAPLHL
ncbi:hypothetical protein GPECTOR_76g800 [Gonium pectorale]|uniref:Uncharacterized protein n=1 Tax=Gonium pectorale TaxID=33097 RepID=A0A150G2B6_GONPE|nr:hypothetical protein GPECTOR_76g800 [Gonium pectorale]|eukprot:KXZ43978.1 hypothetical protein GPECTOR_76g800 [Gonium pectorale]